MDESELRRRFKELREADGVDTPGFSQIHARGRSRRSKRAITSAHPLVIGAAAGLVIATLWLVKARSYSPPLVTPAIATWRAPTDIFLSTPGSELLRTMPALNKSVLDKMIPTPSNRGT